MKTVIAACFALLSLLSPATASVIYEFTGTFRSSTLTIEATFPSYISAGYPTSSISLTEDPLGLNPCQFSVANPTSSLGVGFECLSENFNATSGYGAFGVALFDRSFPTADGTYPIQYSQIEDYSGVNLGPGLSSLIITTVNSTTPEPASMALVSLAMLLCLFRLKARWVRQLVTQRTSTMAE